MSDNTETSPLVTLHLLFWPGLLLAGAGIALRATEGADEGSAAVWGVLVPVGGVLVTIAVIGFGVMLGVRAATERRR